MSNRMGIAIDLNTQPAVQRRTLFQRIRVLVVILMVIGNISSVRAWYFPEHAELSRMALQDRASTDVIKVLEHAIQEANADGLHLCPGATLPFDRIELQRDWIAQCVSYGSLTALAGDHANDVVELRKLLGLQKGRPWPGEEVEVARLITGAAVKNWKSYLSTATTEDALVWTGILVNKTAELGVSQKRDRRSWVADLDIVLTTLDHEYLDRTTGSKTHFHNATLALHHILKQLLSGDLDNALAQALVHHARSLQLALRSKEVTNEADRRALITEALLEHAFAVHFLEDGFASGHLAVDPSFSESISRKRRHDYFNRQGLEMTRALRPKRCSFDTGVGRKAWRNTPACWIAHGDGYLTMTDRWVAGEAVARLQTVFALALLQPKETPAIETGCPDITPSEYETGLGNFDWLLDPKEISQGLPVQFRCAFAELKQIPLAPVRSAGTTNGFQLFSYDQQWLGCPLKAKEGADPTCERHYIDYLWRPLLLDWPASTARIDTLEGSDGFGAGLSYQISASSGLGCNGWLVCREAVSATATVAIGLGLSTTGLLPKRRQYSILELNTGIFFTPFLGSNENDRFVTGITIELRSPITTMILVGAGFLWRSITPTLLVTNEAIRIGIFGGRLFLQALSQTIQVRAWDIEVVDIRLNGSDEKLSPSRSTSMDTEIRVHLGWESLSSPMDQMFNGSFTIKAEVIGGYYGYF